MFNSTQNNSLITQKQCTIFIVRTIFFSCECEIYINHTWYTCILIILICNKNNTFVYGYIGPLPIICNCVCVDFFYSRTCTDSMLKIYSNNFWIRPKYRDFFPDIAPTWWWFNFCGMLGNTLCWYLFCNASLLYKKSYTSFCCWRGRINSSGELNYNRPFQDSK